MKLSPEDHDLLELNWGLSQGYYMRSGGSRGVRHFLHKVIALRMGLIDQLSGTGRKTAVSHKNGDKQDNRRENLEFVTQQQNALNYNDPLRKNNKSGIRGVSWDRKLNKWRAAVMYSRKSYHLGHFADKQLAADAVLKFIDKIHLDMATSDKYNNINA